MQQQLKSATPLLLVLTLYLQQQKSQDAGCARPDRRGGVQAADPVPVPVRVLLPQLEEWRSLGRGVAGPHGFAQRATRLALHRHHRVIHCVH